MREQFDYTSTCLCVCMPIKDCVSLAYRYIVKLMYICTCTCTCTRLAPTHQPSLLYSGGQSVMSGVSPPGQMDTGGYLPPFLLGSPAAKSVSYV